MKGLRTLAGRRLAETHHAKVVPAADVRRVLTIDRPVERRNLERVVPFAVARDVVLDAPLRIALSECACRAVAQAKGERSHDACGPLDTCLYIGDPVASFVVDHQPDKARFVTAHEALAVIEAAAERGDVHTLWFKDAAGGRMYAICNCCSCCCIGLQAHREGFRVLVGSGFVAAVDALECDACGLCVRGCAFRAMSVADGRLVISEELCFGCGTCVARCARRAIRLRVAELGPAPMPTEVS